MSVNMWIRCFKFKKYEWKGSSVIDIEDRLGKFSSQRIFTSDSLGITGNTMNKVVMVKPEMVCLRSVVL